MKPPPCILIFAALLASALTATAQTNEGGLDQGKALFRSNCAFCHGLTAKGGRGPSLISSTLLTSASDDAIRNIISRGVPGTTMPAFEFQKDDLKNLTGFLRTLTGAEPAAKTSGNAAAGKVVYTRNGCAGCHRIGNTGSIYGPELTRIGAGRSYDYLKESIVNPSADIAENFEGVTVVTRDGKRLTGIRVNEDSFTVQLRNAGQNFSLFDKAEVKEVIHETKSVMPAYPSLAAADLENLIAYLATLRGPQASGAEANKAEGIH